GLSELNVRPVTLRVVVSVRSGDCPWALTGPLIKPRSGLGYDRANVVSERGRASSDTSYVMNGSPYVMRPLPVRCDGSPGPSCRKRSASAKRTSSHDESSVAVPYAVPPRRGNAGYRYSIERRSIDVAFTSK